jgi:very-short-patch-repair endonuclease
MDAKFVSAAQIAARQHGRITTSQLRDCGIGKSGIEKGIRAGRLHRVHVGVFALGHVAPSRESNWHAAVLACGPQAALSVRCAANAFAFHDRVAGLIDVTIPSGGRRRPGILIHRAVLASFEMTTWQEIPITSPSRTMVDLAHELRDEERIEWAMRQLQFRRLYHRQLLELSNHRRPNRTISRLLAGFAPTQSPLEVAFLHRVVRRHHLPAPEVNEKVCGFLVDFLWPEAKLIVETDGGQHDEPMMKAADQARDRIHAAAGYRTLRYRWADVHAHDLRTATEIRALLDAGVTNKASPGCLSRQWWA